MCFSFMVLSAAINGSVDSIVMVGVDITFLAVIFVGSADGLRIFPSISFWLIIPMTVLFSVTRTEVALLSSMVSAISVSVAVLGTWMIGVPVRLSEAVSVMLVPLFQMSFRSSPVLSTYF